MARDSMTLDEVIQFTKQALEKVNPDKRVSTEFRFTVGQVKQLLVWLEDYKQLKADYADLDNRLRTANTENDELKRMLKLAVDDLDTAIKSCEQDMLCEICSYHEECHYINYCGGEYDRTWKHRDEAMKLLGGAENVEDRTA